MGTLIFINIISAFSVFAIVKAVYDIIMRGREERYKQKRDLSSSYHPS